MIAAPIIQQVGNLFVVRDDLIPGGTKTRVLPVLLGDAPEYVYASPAYGYAQIALAHVCRSYGKQATVFVAKRAGMHPRTAEAMAAGAKVVPVQPGYLSVVQAAARAYCAERGATYLPFGLDVPAVRDALAVVVRSLQINPREVWCVAGSGMLTRALQQAWPDAEHHAVMVGHEADCGTAIVHRAPERFEQDAKVPPPFPSCSNYDAKAWRFITRHARPGALFYNVAA